MRLALLALALVTAGVGAVYWLTRDLSALDLLLDDPRRRR